MKKVAIYIRISTQEQAQEGYSIGEQRERLTAYCKAHGWIIADVYVDGGYTGSNLNRPAIQKLISEINQIDTVLVYKLDRLSRSQRDTLYLIEEIFLPNKVDFVSMQESFDTSSPFGKAMIGLLAVFAQLEREQIKERTYMGRMARAKQGLYHGGGYHTPFGYNYQDGKLIVNPYEAEQVKKIYAWFLEGSSLCAIAKKLKAEGYRDSNGKFKDFSTVRSYLCNAIYTGRIKFGEIIVENAHEAIISKETFQAVQERFELIRGQYGKHGFQAKYLLTGLLICGRCGARYFCHSNKVNGIHYKYYICYSRRKHIRRLVKDTNCRNKTWRIEVLDSLIKERVREVIMSPEILKEIIAHKKDQSSSNNQNNSDILKIKQRIHEIDKQIGKLMDLYQVDGIPPEILGNKINALYHEKTTLEATCGPKDEEVQKSFNLIESMISDAAQVWDYADDAQKRRIIQSFIKRIVLNGEDVQIEWLF